VSIAEVEAMSVDRLVYWHGRAFRHFEHKQAAITQDVAGQKPR
jgi:hypothetical protein